MTPTIVDLFYEFEFGFREKGKRIRVSFTII